MSNLANDANQHLRFDSDHGRMQKRKRQRQSPFGRC